MTRTRLLIVMSQLVSLQPNASPVIMETMQPSCVIFAVRAGCGDGAYSLGLSLKLTQLIALKTRMHSTSAFPKPDNTLNHIRLIFMNSRFNFLQ